jgi:predicted nucleotide-binding protein (sugar kinase/HSP70/actin superfamily)
VNALYRKYTELIIKQLDNLNMFGFYKLYQQCIEWFGRLPLRHMHKPEIAVLSGILVKLHSVASNNIVSLIKRDGVERVVPEFADFFLYPLTDGKLKHRQLSDQFYQNWISCFLVWFTELYR